MTNTVDSKQQTINELHQFLTDRMKELERICNDGISQSGNGDWRLLFAWLLAIANSICTTMDLLAWDATPGLRLQVLRGLTAPFRGDPSFNPEWLR